MRKKVTKSKNAEHYSIIYDIKINGKKTSKVYENIGNYNKLVERAGDKDPLTWLENYIEELNKKQKENNLPVIIEKYQNRLISKDKQRLFNGGYLFLQQIYYDLKLDKICKNIFDEYQIHFDLDNILSRLIYGRVLHPASKIATYEFSKTLLEQPNFDSHQIYRALEIIAKEDNFIQAQLYKNSAKLSPRNNKILYYDCTNFFFEIDEAEDDKQYGPSKENKPNPIVQMGLFMDGDGIPLAFNITPGNQNEQKTLKPLEEQIIKDFNLSKIVVCTDAGLASKSNRLFNNKNDKCFITTQSIKKLKKELKDWALDKTNWKLPGYENKVIDISKLETSEELSKKFKDVTFYKERWIKEDGLEQRLIVTYSVKYRDYIRHIREGQIERAKKLIESNPKKLGKVRQNDPKRFIDTITTTSNGEIANENHYFLSQEKIDEEKQYDGYYAVCTNLKDDALEIIKVNHRRWEIEESFRIMKSEFEARPVYLKRQDRIKAHFMVCFISLIIYRYLEKKLDNKYTVCEIIDTLKNMNFLQEKENYFSPTYTRTDLTDLLHEKFGFRTDYETIDLKNFKKIFTQTKK